MVRRHARRSLVYEGSFFIAAQPSSITFAIRTCASLRCRDLATSARGMRCAIYGRKRRRLASVVCATTTLLTDYRRFESLKRLILAVRAWATGKKVSMLINRRVTKAFINILVVCLTSCFSESIDCQRVLEIIR